MRLSPVQVLLCLVVEVVCSGAGRGLRNGGRTPEPKSGVGGPELLGYVLALDLGCVLLWRGKGYAYI